MRRRKKHSRGGSSRSLSNVRRPIGYVIHVVASQRKKAHVPVSGLIIALLVLPGLHVVKTAEAQSESTTYPDRIVFVHYLDEQVAIREVQSGDVDVYFWRVPLALTDQLKNDPNVIVSEAPGGTLSLLLNPAPTLNSFNPFTLKGVRYAINYLINRDFVVNELLKGYGAVMTSVYGPFDPDYFVVAEQIEALGIRYNPELARKILADELRKVGAEFIEGQWFYQGRPVAIKFFIRSDDPYRKALGEALARELSNAGLKTEKIFGDLTKAFDLVYGSDPKEGGWHLYTEGWGRSLFVKYDTVTIAQMYAPWYGSMPGFRESSYWNYENKELDEATQKITTGNFSSREERDDLVRRAANDGVQEAVRLFIATMIDPYVSNSGLKGLVNDFGAGITARWTFLNLRKTAPLSDVKIGMKQIYQGSWNPVRGLTDWYSTRIWTALSDPAVWTHPHTGEIVPVRAAWRVETAGPKGALDVPSDAVLWDPRGQSWKDVVAGVKSTSKVTFNLKLSNWHHGPAMSRADLLYGIYFLFEWGTRTDENDRTFDPEYTSQTEPLLKTIKGVRFLADDKVEAYVDYWHFDENFIAEYFTIWAAMPWEVGAAMEKLVLEKKVAFSRSASRAQGVEWLSLIIKSNAVMLADSLREFRDQRFIPRSLKDLVSASDAAERYNAALKWIEARGHAVISNGPYYFETYNPDARTMTIRAFKDSRYPFLPGQWREYEVAKTAVIKRVEVPTLVEVGGLINVNVNVDVGGIPISDASVTYRIINPQGTTIIQGQAQIKPSPGEYEILLSSDVTGKLRPGAYTLTIVAVSQKAIKPDIYQVAFAAIPPGLMRFEERERQLVTKVAVGSNWPLIVFAALMVTLVSAIIVSKKPWRKQYQSASLMLGNVDGFRSVSGI